MIHYIVTHDSGFFLFFILTSLSLWGQALTQQEAVNTGVNLPFTRGSDMTSHEHLESKRHINTLQHIQLDPLDPIFFYIIYAARMEPRAEPPSGPL